MDEYSRMVIVQQIGLFRVYEYTILHIAVRENKFCNVFCYCKISFCNPLPFTNVSCQMGQILKGGSTHFNTRFPS